ncbi:hypothetical protein BaRGS_00036452 [Batillaria attramentaria]|uniref:Uncharacterized protein n=1 Tax=Batillaria attramentaria TaxID=370345 RepID=A0ABD0JBG1_9CAEN
MSDWSLSLIRAVPSSLNLNCSSTRGDGQTPHAVCTIDRSRLSDTVCDGHAATKVFFQVTGNKTGSQTCEVNLSAASCDDHVLAGGCGCIERRGEREVFQYRPVVNQSGYYRGTVNCSTDCRDQANGNPVWTGSDTCVMKSMPKRDNTETGGSTRVEYSARGCILTIISLSLSCLMRSHYFTV